jgi:hypothetical protein
MHDTVRLPRQNGWLGSGTGLIPEWEYDARIEKESSLWHHPTVDFLSRDLECLEGLLEAQPGHVSDRRDVDPFPKRIRCHFEGIGAEQDRR